MFWLYLPSSLDARVLVPAILEPDMFFLEYLEMVAPTHFVENAAINCCVSVKEEIS